MYSVILSLSYTHVLLTFFPLKINLLDGLPSLFYKETCTAGAGTMLLEFGILSRLLGDPVFENLARKAVAALWKHRSRETGLLGKEACHCYHCWLSPGFCVIGCVSCVAAKTATDIWWYPNVILNWPQNFCQICIWHLLWRELQFSSHVRLLHVFKLKAVNISIWD